jgi:hypothetical protein
MFVNAMRKGTHLGGDGRVILPPMPWPAIGQTSGAGLEAIFAYLQSLPPIRSDVPENQVAPAVLGAMSVATKKRIAEDKAHYGPRK